ncbi:MAG: menaquinone biosynthesis protein [Syntrophobacterales bacterium]|jgi:chorismate dehydratase|nr:menaquinone biosynthesis protein [Syntrophobacterales bacterium]
MMAKARLGRIAYLNVLPIYFAMENIFGENGFHLVRGTPAELNGLMRRGEVDLGSISAMEYGRAWRDYLLLPDLSISSRGAVGSVLLFSRVPFSRLDGRPVRVSAASASGAALVKVLLTELFGVQPCYRSGQASAPLEDCAAVLAIGDEALRLKAAGTMPFELDLGEAWQELTGLPFVFGVWAVRRDFAGIEPAATAALHRLLLRSRDWGLTSLAELSRIAGASFNMTPAQILAYFHQLNYFLDADHQEGLATFFHYLYNLGELAEEPGLEYFGG